MCEPLRKKVDKSRIDEEHYKELFWKDDVKSAVEGAIKELEEIVAEDNVVNPRAFMKYWFEDVVD